MLDDAITEVEVDETLVRDAHFFRERFEQIFERLPLVKEVKPKFGTYGFHNPTLRLYALNDGALDQARARMK